MLTGVLVKPLLLSMTILTRTTDKPPRSALPQICCSALQPGIHNSNELCNLSLHTGIKHVQQLALLPLLCLQNMTAASESPSVSLVSQPGVAACQVSGMALTGLTLQALSRAMDLAPHHNQILQEVQEAKIHLTLQQLAEVEQTTC